MKEEIEKKHVLDGEGANLSGLLPEVSDVDKLMLHMLNHSTGMKQSKRIKRKRAYSSSTMQTHEKLILNQENPASVDFD